MKIGTDGRLNDGTATKIPPEIASKMTQATNSSHLASERGDDKIDHRVIQPIERPNDSHLDDDRSADRFAETSGIIAKVPKSTWRSYIWDTLDKEPEERRFLFKLDAVLITLASLGYFIKYLDQVNVNSAFVSGMKEDLGLYGNQLNYMITAWTVGYVIGEIPR